MVFALIDLYPGHYEDKYRVDPSVLSVRFHRVFPDTKHKGILD